MRELRFLRSTEPGIKDSLEGQTIKKWQKVQKQSDLLSESSSSSKPSPSGSGSMFPFITLRLFRGMGSLSSDSDEDSSRTRLRPPEASEPGEDRLRARLGGEISEEVLEASLSNSICSRCAGREGFPNQSLQSNGWNGEFQDLPSSEDADGESDNNLDLDTPFSFRASRGASESELEDPAFVRS